MIVVEDNDNFLQNVNWYQCYFFDNFFVVKNNSFYLPPNDSSVYMEVAFQFVENYIVKINKRMLTFNELIEYFYIGKDPINDNNSFYRYYALRSNLGDPYVVYRIYYF